MTFGFSGFFPGLGVAFLLACLKACPSGYLVWEFYRLVRRRSLSGLWRGVLLACLKVGLPVLRTISGVLVERNGCVGRGVGVAFRCFGKACGDRVLVNVVLADGVVFVAANLVIGEASLPDREF